MCYCAQAPAGAFVEFFLRQGSDRRYITAHDDIGPAQAWAAALYHHPDAPDGILYWIRHDNDPIGVALFDRSGSTLSWVSSEAWRYSPHLNDMCDRYELIL